MNRVVITPDLKLRKEIGAKLKANGGHCPCRFEKTEDTICPCKDFRETAECICGLYVKIPDIEEGS